MKDVKLCCDCLRDISFFDERDVVLRSQMSEEEKKKLGARFNGEGLIEVYLCRSCYETRFKPGK